MSEVKEVKVALTDADVEALSRPTRRRRGTRRQTAGASLGLESGPVVKESAPVGPVGPAVTTTLHPRSPALPQPLPAIVKADPTPPPIEASSSMTPVALPISSAQPPAPSTVVASGGGVKIQSRKRTHGLPTSAPLNPLATRKIAGGARIVPVKRHSGLGGHQTLKKPRFVVVPKATPAAAAAATAGTPAPVAKASPPTATNPPKKNKRRFTERRLSISVKQVSSTRKQRKSIKKEVAAMPLATLRKTLVEKGMLKPKSNPPESMMRSMMADYLSLKHSQV